MVTLLRAMAYLDSVCFMLDNISACSACRRATAVETAAKYVTMFGDEDGSVPATYQVGSTGTSWFDLLSAVKSPA